MRKTKIIGTLGPASETHKTLTEMVRAGLNVVRLNLSHGTHADHARRIALVKQVREELSCPIALLLDTRGPEIRLGKIAGGSAEVTEGSIFTIAPDVEEGTAERAGVTCGDFSKIVKKGDFVLINDGLIRMQVEQVVDRDVRLRVITGGVISDHKSINVPGVQLNLPYMSEQDRADVLFGIEQGVEFIAASFVSTADDVLTLKRFLANNGGTEIQVIAKIESKRGVDNIDEIIRVADGIMVARGDLGVEISYEQLPQIQKLLIKKARTAGKRVITATEMLESMIHSPRPTRAEASDVANAVYDGTSAVMLSGETAAGKYPVEAVRAMAQIAENTERCIHYRKRFMMSDFEVRNVADAISNAAVKSSLDLDASAVIVVTDSGTSARMISRFRPICPIIAITANPKTYYRLAMSWGVMPLRGTRQNSMEELFRHAIDTAKYCNAIKSGDTVIMVASTQVSAPGSTNLLRIEHID